MNELIKQFAEESSTYARQTVTYYNGQFEGLTWNGKVVLVRDAKFAELIIREAAKFVDLADENKCESIGDSLLMYFGVEA